MPANHKGPIQNGKHLEPNGERIGNRGLTQSYLLRDIAANAAIELGKTPIQDGETAAQRASALASLIRAWDAASERMRLIRGRPLPGTLSAAERRERNKRPAQKRSEPRASIQLSSHATAPNLPAASAPSAPSLQGAGTAEGQVAGGTVREQEAQQPGAAMTDSTRTAPSGPVAAKESLSPERTVGTGGGGEGRGKDGTGC